jgi:hypothetical protein
MQDVLFNLVIGGFVDGIIVTSRDYQLSITFQYSYVELVLGR